MDSFTQHMIEKAEQRNRALGLNNAITRPAPEVTTRASPQKVQKLVNVTKHNNVGVANSNKLQVVERAAPLEISSSSGASNVPASAAKVLRQFTAYDKENMDLGIEINIISKNEVDVQVEVEEQELTDNDEGANNAPHTIAKQPLAKTRNQLQRLGALYSNNDDLSSPIHRTEGQFHADTVDDIDNVAHARKPKQRFGKLAALANTINEWEDDLHDPHGNVRSAVVPPQKPDLPSRRQAPKPPQTNKDHTKTTSSVSEDNIETGEMAKTKKLNWDPKVIDSLEAQGFQRRESSTVKFAYDYNKTNLEKTLTETPLNDVETFSSVTKIVGNLTTGKNTKQDTKPQTTISVEKPTVSVPMRSGLVSGRAAVFEQKANSQQMQRPQKDPTELSLKERMQLFERNKGEALIPKAALGMAPSINQIRQENLHKKEEAKAILTGNINKAPTTAVINHKADSKVRDKVAALVANATTISENKIRADIQKQREEDMQVLANRFKRAKETVTKDDENESTTNVANKPVQRDVKVQRTGMPPPPPPPPPPPTAVSMNSPSCSKRRSPGDAIEESKRPKVQKQPSTNQLYPTLSDFESNDSESDNCNGGTTATVSPINMRNTNSQQRRLMEETEDDEDEDNDSYMGESEMMADDDDSSADIYNGSLGRDIMKVVVQKNDNKHQEQEKQRLQKHKKEVHYADKNFYIENRGDSYLNSSDGSMCIDDCLDEALDADFNYTQSDDCDESDTGNSSRLSRGSKGTAASNSFSFRKAPHKFTTYRTISEEQTADDDDDNYHTPTNINASAGATPGPVKSNLKVNQDDENMVTLVHTVSFYRRQQNTNSANNTPIRKICREQQIQRSEMITATNSGNTINDFNAQFQYETNNENCENSNVSDDYDSQQTEPDNEYLAREKVKKLLDEVKKQEVQIAQASQALNVCAATVEFSGSTESVEAERHLLVATHRRLACLDEIQRLSIEKSLRPLGAPKERGQLTIKEITVPLRQDYIKKLSKDTISGHHLVCLVKYNETVLATRTVPTLPGLLAVKFPDVLNLTNVYADFRVTVEIYGMTAQREVLPHEVKYHINLNKKSGIKTPKKKAGDNILVMPPIQSPAGPNVVRSPALVHYGQAIFSLREVQRTTWQLQQVLNVSPLEGVLHMKVQCILSVSVEYKGFLTMYEDISGFGSWHRRWCHLNGSVLNYWKYPDDERKKTPMGSIDLYSCISPKIALAPRDICARLHTILLECTRPAKETDKESLIIVPNGSETIERYLLSADTKEEREEWCAFFNKALALLRAWGPPN